MNADKVTPIRPTGGPDADDEVYEALAHARATLDLIRSLAYDATGEALESLDKGTLDWALSGAIEHIDEAIKAAERLNAKALAATKARDAAQETQP